MTAPDEPIPCKANGCGRPLTTAASRARGMGPVCAEKLNPPPPARHAIPAGPSTSSRPAPLPAGPDLLDELDGTQ